jgi:hypothetical protein
MWKLWKTRQPSALAKGVAAIPVPGEKSDHQIHMIGRGHLISIGSRPDFQASLSLEVLGWSCG